MNGLASGIACLSMMLTMPAVANDSAITQEQFDSWIFENFDNPEKPLPTLEAQCNLELSRISRTTNLRDDQKEQLRLAGQGDINRFFRRVEMARQQCRAINERHAASDGSRQQNEEPFGNANEPFEEAYSLALPLQRELRKGLFGSKSLMQKVATNLLDEQQAETLKEDSSRIARLRAERAVRVFVAKLGWHMPLTTVQRTNLTDLLFQNIKSMPDAGPFAYYIVMYRFGKIPREQYEAFFDKAQMTTISNMLKQGQELRDYLEQEGVLDDE